MAHFRWTYASKSKGICVSFSPHCAAAHCALHAVKAPQLGQFAAPALKFVYASLQVVRQLAELLHSSNILHKDTLLQKQQDTISAKNI